MIHPALLGKIEHIPALRNNTTVAVTTASGLAHIQRDPIFSIRIGQIEIDVQITVTTVNDLEGV